jgi:hypothetical protein
VIASFHLVTFRRRTLLPRGAAPGRVDGLRFWRPLFTAAEPMTSVPPDISRIRVMKPNLREWAFFGVWETEADIDRFLTTSRVADVWRNETAETWSIRLKPISFRGEWPGVRRLRGFEEIDLPRTPAAVITRIDLPWRALGPMWRSAAIELAPHLPSAPGLLTGSAMVDRFYAHPMTFSVWSSAEDAMRFAYGEGPHQQAVRRLRKLVRTSRRGSRARCSIHAVRKGRGGG